MQKFCRFLIQQKWTEKRQIYGNSGDGDDSTSEIKEDTINSYHVKKNEDKQATFDSVHIRAAIFTHGAKQFNYACTGRQQNCEKPKCVMVYTCETWAYV